MTSPSDTNKKDTIGRKVLTIKSHKPGLTHNKTAVKKLHGSTIVVISGGTKQNDIVSDDVYGALTEQEKATRLDALRIASVKHSVQHDVTNELPESGNAVKSNDEHKITIPSEEHNERIKTSITTEKSIKSTNHDVIDVDVIPHEQSGAIDTQATTKVKEKNYTNIKNVATKKDAEKKHDVARTITRPKSLSERRHRKVEVNFDDDSKKKLKNLDLNTKKIEKPTDHEKTKTIERIVAASTIKKVEANKKKIVHTKRTSDDEHDGRNGADVKQAKSKSYRISASYRAKLASGDYDDMSYHRSKLPKHKKKPQQIRQIEKVIRDVTITDAITVQELANKMAEKSGAVLRILMKLGVASTLNSSIDADTAELVVMEFGHRPHRVTQENIIRDLIGEDGTSVMQHRAPIVTIMGHVDHGKTSLLDALRETDIASKEHGGITQHIGAYQVHLTNNKAITFLDTPGHEAFSAMRMRGAKVTDIVVLVVAADDGIKAQTIEAISHAKAANVPIIVAVNKMDKQGANFELVKQSLLQYDIIPDDMGGDVMVVGVSALTKSGLDKLEEVILIQSELLDLHADYNHRARGYVIEAKLDKMKGFTATLLVQNGRLKVSDIVVAGSMYGRIRTMCDDKGQQIQEAFPAMPVEITGLDSVPAAGDEFIVMQNERTARELVEIRKQQEHKRKLAALETKSIKEIFLSQASNKSKEITLLIKADVHGSAEAIIHSINKIDNPEVRVKIVHYGAGAINESDITLAAASNALIIGFNVRPNSNAKVMANNIRVNIKYYSIIYDLIDDIRLIVSDMMDPIMKEHIIGIAEIRKVINTSKFGNIAGCYVKDGIVRRGAQARVLHDNMVVCTGIINTLKRQKDDVREVKEGFECGITLSNYDSFSDGDAIEVFETINTSKGATNIHR